MYTHARGRKLAHPWEGKVEPFKMAGNIYFIGTYQGSTHIIDTGDGLILADLTGAKTLIGEYDAPYLEEKEGKEI